MSGLDTTNSAEMVNDPVGHISISGVHGGDELNDRLARADEMSRTPGQRGGLGILIIGVALGAALALTLGRRGRTRVRLMTP
jgi:hypothetical protein